MIKPGAAKIFKAIIKVLGWTLTILLTLLIIIILSIRTPYVQSKLVGEAEGFLETKLSTKVTIGGAYLNFPKSIELSSLYLEDLKGDTLLHINSLEVDTDLWALLDNEIQIKSLDLKNTTGKINRDSLTKEFNYQFIIDAFSTTDTTPQTTGKPWTFNIHDINLSAIRFSMNDEVAGIKLNASLKDLEIDVDDLNLESPSLAIDNIDLVGANFSYIQNQIKSNIDKNEPKEDNASIFDFSLNELNISNSIFYYQTQGQCISGKVSTLNLELDDMNLPEQRIEVKNFLLENSQVRIASTSSSDSTSSSATPTQNNWQVSASNLKLSNNKVEFQLDTAEVSANHFDANHIIVSKLDAALSNTLYSEDSIYTEIKNLAFLSDEMPLKVKGNFIMHKSGMLFSDGLVQLGKGNININAKLNYDSLNHLVDPLTKVDVIISNSTIYSNDLEYFVPTLSQTKLPDHINIEGQFNGLVGDLNISGLKMTTPHSELALTGNLKSLTRTENLSFDIQKLEVKSSADELLPYLPDSLRAQLSLPEFIKIKADGKGNMTSFQGNLIFNSSYGDLKLDIDSLDLRDSIPHYAMLLNSKGISIGRLLKQENGDLYSLQFDLKINGQGTEMSSLKSAAKGVISNIHYNDYTYGSIAIDAKIDKGLIEGILKVNDDNLCMDLNGEIDMSSELHKNHITLNLLKADLQALNFSLTPLILKGGLITDFETKDFKKFNGNIAIRDFSADNDIDIYTVDSLLVASIEQDQSTNITIDSDIMQGEFKGNIDLFTVGKSLKQHINSYYDSSNAANDSLTDINFTFDLDLKNTDLLTEIIIPGLQEFEPGHFKAAFNSTANKLDIDFDIHHLKYSDIVIDNFKLKTSSSNQKLISNLIIEHISSSNAQIKNFNIEAILENNELMTSLFVNDSIGQRKYYIGGAVQRVDSSYQLRLDDSRLILNYDPWKVEQDRPLIIGNSTAKQATALRLSKGSEAITFQNSPSNSTLQIGFSNFALSTIGAALKKQEDLLNGKLNGNIDILFRSVGTGFIADLDIDNLKIMSKEWGDFKLNISPINNGNYLAKIDLKSSLNILSITSEYNLKQTEDISLKANIDKFDLTTIAPIVKNSAKKLEGTVQGQLNLKNGFTTPIINGSLTLNKLSVNPSSLNNNLKVEKETIRFKDSKIVLSQFKLEDETGNSAIIDGQVEMVNLSFYNLDLSLTAKNFMLLNTTNEDNELFYGILKTDGKVTITGSTLRPEISANLKLLEESNITYVVPDTEYYMASSENIVEFVNPNEEVQQQANILNDSVKFLGLELSAKLEIDKAAVLNVVIDPITQDQLKVQGAATLNLDIDRKGDIQLSGKYTVEQGQYNFSFYKLIKREFEIDKGSTITWTGDPFEAILDISAYNKVEAPPIDLMINQINNATNADLQKYRQLLPILVYLNIDGVLAKPEITFKLDMPQDKQNALGGSVYARLLDLNTRESDLNKQVFALLMLQRFISENPLKSEGGYDVEDKTRRSVSRLLSDQLNRLTNNIDAVKINFDLQSYQSYGEGTTSGTTKLELGLSKSLFNDQLEVKVSGNVNLEGEEQKNFSDYVGDLALEYKVTDDGRLRITGFRRSDFDVISGEIVETGAGVIYVRDYNTFRELFRKSDEEE